jgi:hypothetical protein
MIDAPVPTQPGPSRASESATKSLTGVHQFAASRNVDAAWRDAVAWASNVAARHRDVTAEATSAVQFDVRALLEEKIPAVGYDMHGLAMVLRGVGRLWLDRHAASQVAALCKLDLAILDRAVARQSRAIGPLILEEWQARGTDTPVVFRTDGGVLRAVLSSSYQPVDTLPLLRTIRDVVAPLGIGPLRALHTPQLVRIEFARFDARNSRSYVPGLVLTNSEVADASVRIQPAIARMHRRTATRLEREPQLSYRHVGDAQGRIVTALREQIRPILHASEEAIATWHEIRDVSAPAIGNDTVIETLTEVLGRRTAGEVVTAWRAEQSSRQTFKTLFAMAAAHARALPTIEQVRLDSLLDIILAYTDDAAHTTADMAVAGAARVGASDRPERAAR